MDTPETDYLHHALHQYEQSVDETARHLAGAGPVARRCASAPFRERCRLAVLIDSAGVEGPAGTGLWEEFDRIDRKLADFRRENGDRYSRLLREDLSFYVHAWHAAVCHARAGSPIPDEPVDSLTRGLIRELCRELAGEYDLTDIRALIDLLEQQRDAGDSVETLPDRFDGTKAGCRDGAEETPGNAGAGQAP